MNCDEARGAFLAGDTTEAHHDHLATCSECAAISDELSTTLATLEDEGFWEEPPADLEDRLTTLISGMPPEAASTRRRIIRWTAAAAAAVIAVLAVGVAVVALRGPAPDWEVALPGTPVAPGAEGTVQGWNETGGTRLRFEIAGLDVAPEGSVYEVWFSRGPLHISAGTFTSGESLDMWAGIARRDYPRIWITLEPLDTDESPSGVTVMDTG